MPAELDRVDVHGGGDGGGACGSGVEGDGDCVGGDFADGSKHERVSGWVGAVDPAGGGTGGDGAGVGAIAVEGDAGGAGVVAPAAEIGICGIDCEDWSSGFILFWSVNGRCGLKLGWAHSLGTGTAEHHSLAGMQRPEVLGQFGGHLGSGCCEGLERIEADLRADKSQGRCPT